MAKVLSSVEIRLYPALSYYILCETTAFTLCLALSDSILQVAFDSIPSAEVEAGQLYLIQAHRHHHLSSTTHEAQTDN